MSPADHERYADAAAPYVLGALPELEERAFARHVMGCAQCRDEVERLRAVAAALPRAVTPLDPPPALRRSIMDAVTADAAPGEGAIRPRLERVRRRLRPGVGGLRPAAAWASAAFVLATGVLAGYGAAQIIGGDPDEERLAASVDEARLAEGSATLILPEGEDRAVLSVHGVPTLPDDDTNEIYQLWLVRGNEVTPSSLMTVGADGSGTATVPQGVDDADAIWVTREAAGGSRAPTERPVISVTLD